MNGRNRLICSELNDTSVAHTRMSRWQRHDTSTGPHLIYIELDIICTQSLSSKEVDTNELPLLT